MAWSGYFWPLCGSVSATKDWLVLSADNDSAFAVAHTNWGKHATQFPAHGYLYLSPNQGFITGLEDVP
tara:strand:+ start:712 stop:915 length:204 start_codon:yes stop_codon:yes gene_type:complete